MNHAWHTLRRSLGHNLQNKSWMGCGTARIITFTAVIVGWVFFRAQSFEGAVSILSSMFGGNGLSFPGEFKGPLGGIGTWLASMGVDFVWPIANPVFNESMGIGVLMLAFLLLIAWYAPNTQQIMIRHQPALETYRDEIKEWHYRKVQWQPNRLFGLAIGILIFLIMKISLSAPTSEFLYFNFLA